METVTKARANMVCVVTYALSGCSCNTTPCEPRFVGTEPACHKGVEVDSPRQKPLLSVYVCHGVSPLQCIPGHHRQLECPGVVCEACECGRASGHGFGGRGGVWDASKQVGFVAFVG